MSDTLLDYAPKKPLALFGRGNATPSLVVDLLHPDFPDYAAAKVWLNDPRGKVATPDGLALLRLMEKAPETLEVCRRVEKLLAWCRESNVGIPEGQERPLRKLLKSIFAEPKFAWYDHSPEDQEKAHKREQR